MIKLLVCAVVIQVTSRIQSLLMSHQAAMMWTKIGTLTMVYSALESIADRYYEHSMHAQQETATQGSQREAEHKLTFERFQRGCSCSLNCFSVFTIAEVANVRCSVKALTKSEGYVTTWEAADIL